MDIKFCQNSNPVVMKFYSYFNVTQMVNRTHQVLTFTIDFNRILLYIVNHPSHYYL